MKTNNNYLITLFLFVLSCISMQAQTSPYEWSLEPGKNTLEALGATVSHTGGTYTDYTITCTEAEKAICGEEVFTKAAKFDSNGIITFTTTTMCNVTVGIVLRTNINITYTPQNAAVKLDGSLTSSAIISENKNMTDCTEDIHGFVTFKNVMPGTHTLTRASQVELGVFYVRVDELNSNIGAADYSTPWWTNFSDSYHIQPGTELNFTMQVHGGDLNYNNWALIGANHPTAHSDTEENTYKEYLAMTPNTHIWKGGTSTLYDVKNANKAYTSEGNNVSPSLNEVSERFINDMKDATSNVKVTYNGSNIYVYAKTTSNVADSEGNTYTWITTAVQPVAEPPADMYMFFTVEKSYLTDFAVTENIAYTVSAQSESNGEVKITNEDEIEIPSGAQIGAGTSLTITATPSTNCVFTGWSVGAEGETFSTAPTLIISSLNSDINYVAHFAQAPTYTLLESNGGTSYMSKTVDGETQIVNNGTVALDTEVSFNAIPHSGYRFVKWVDGAGNDVENGTQNPYISTATEGNDVTLRAVFEVVLTYGAASWDFDDIARRCENNTYISLGSTTFTVNGKTFFVSTATNSASNTETLGTDNRFGVSTNDDGGTYGWRMKNDTYHNSFGLQNTGTKTRWIGIDNCIKGQKITVWASNTPPAEQLYNLTLIESVQNDYYVYEVNANGGVYWGFSRYNSGTYEALIHKITIEARTIYTDDCSSTATWKWNGGTADNEEGCVRFSTPNADDLRGPRYRYTLFNAIKSETIYTIEFDAKLGHSSEQDKEKNSIWLMAQKPNPSIPSSPYAGNYLMYLRESAHGTHSLNGEDATFDLTAGTFYHFKIDVDGKNRIATTTISTTADGATIATSTYNIPVGQSTKAEGIYFLQERWVAANVPSAFDNIRITTPQTPIGTVTEPVIEVTSVNGNDRTVMITSGKSETGLQVVTFYSLDNGVTWNTFTENEKTINLSASVPTTAHILAYSRVEDYDIVDSETAYLDVPYGEAWQLTGGFEIVDMQQNRDVTFKDGSYGSVHHYYTPNLKVFVDSNILPENTRFNVLVTYLPYEYGNGEPREEKTWAALTASNINSSKSADYHTASADLVPESGEYTLTISADGFKTGVYKRLFYTGKYKKSFQTVNYSSYANLDSGDKANWQEISHVDVPDWTTADEVKDYAWQKSQSGITATLIAVTSATSGGSKQDYNFRTTQTRLDNGIFLREGYGLIKNVNYAWNYRGAQANIGNCNEIGMLTYVDANGTIPNIMYALPFNNKSDVPEVNFNVPAHAAVQQYTVFTPVDTKDIAATGLSTFCSYYPLYSVQDVYIENNVDAYRTVNPNDGATHGAYGKQYRLQICWYVQEREGILAAGYAFNGKKIWDKTAIDAAASTFTGGKTVEFRIIPNVKGVRGANGRALWSGANEFRGILHPVNMENGANNFETKGDKVWYNGQWYTKVNAYDEDRNHFKSPNLILHSGTSYGVENCTNFYTIPKATDYSLLANNSAYLHLPTANWEDYQINKGENGEDIQLGESQAKYVGIIFGDDDDEPITAIDKITTENNDASVSTDDAFYTISGQRIAVPTAKGIYIHNGKKILVK